MKKLQKTMILVTFCTALLMLISGTTALSAEKEKRVILKIPSAFPLSMPVIGDTMKWYKKQVELLSQGSIRVKLYDPGKLVPPLEIHDSVSRGSVNAGFTAAGYLVGRIPASDLFVSYPFCPDAVGKLAWFYNGNGYKLYQEMYDKHGYQIKPLVTVVVPPASGGWFKKRADNPSDIKGLKVRYGVNGGQVLAEMGASVSMLPFSEVFSAMEKGVLDAAELTVPSTDFKFGMYKIAKYNYFPGWHEQSTMAELIINKKVWNSMSKRQQGVLEIVSKAASVQSLALLTATQAEAIEKMEKKHGTRVVKWSDDMLDAMYASWLKVAEKNAAKDEFYNKVWNDIQQFNKGLNRWYKLGYLPRGQYN